MRKNSVRHAYWFVAMVAAIAVAMLAAYAAAQDNPVGDAETASVCANLGEYIFVGGTGGFDGLRDGDQFQELLKTRHVGLYEHANAIAAAEHPPSIIRAIERTFKGTGSGQAELGQVGANYFTLPAKYGYYKDVYIGHGLHPAEANVDTPRDGVPRKELQKYEKNWKEYVDAARTVGIESVAPIVGPNDPKEPKRGNHVFATNPFYALERYEALYGKAMAFDVPPNFFLTGGSGPGYQKFIVQAIQWGNEHGLRTTMLLSPYPWSNNSKGNPDTFRQFKNNTFSRDTQVFVRRLIKEKAIPTEWAVDNYEDPYPHDFYAVVPETVRNTTTEVGLWLARNAPAYANGADNQGVTCGPVESSDGTSGRHYGSLEAMKDIG
jgi:hypothetical protein